MPSPFPGMDPYLEKRSIWSGVHQRLIAYISETIQPLIRPKYIATIGERIQLAVARQSSIPDVLLLHRLCEPTPTLAAVGDLVADEPQTIAYLDEERLVPYIEIIWVCFICFKSYSIQPMEAYNSRKQPPKECLQQHVVFVQPLTVAQVACSQPYPNLWTVA